MNRSQTQSKKQIRLQLLEISVVAAAAMAAGTFLQIGLGWNPAQLEGLGNLLLDGMLKLV